MLAPHSHSNTQKWCSHPSSPRPPLIIFTFCSYKQSDNLTIIQNVCGSFCCRVSAVAPEKRHSILLKIFLLKIHFHQWRRYKLSVILNKQTHSFRYFTATLSIRAVDLFRAVDLLSNRLITERHFHSVQHAPCLDCTIAVYLETDSGVSQRRSGPQPKHSSSVTHC